MRGNLLCKREQSETQFQLCRVQPATDGRQITVVCVKIRNVDFDVHNSTTLPISGYYVAMFGNDEAVRNRFSALLRKEMEVQGQRSVGNSALSVKVASDTPDVGEHFSDERRATEQRRKCV